MKSKKNMFIGCGLLVLSIALFAFGFILSKKDKSYAYIEKVLKTDAYSYLNGDAKEYVKDYYEATGEILLTEKNKEENLPYLNPDFVAYLGLSKDRQKTFEAIPEEIIVDFSYNPDDVEVYADELPSKYDLRAVDVDGDGTADRNYISPLKNQGSLGICWSYATMEAAETYMMIQNDESYTEGTTQLLSPRQLDYAMSNSLKDFNNVYYSHEIGKGSTFSSAIVVPSMGISFFGTSWKYNSSTSSNELELYEVLNYHESLYDLTSTINMPVLNIASLDLTNQDDVAKKDAYLNSIKNGIVNYGGPYVGTFAPGYSCAAVNSLDSSNSTIIRVDSACTKTGGHALQIIGWDDNYEYKYCTGANHTKYTTSCSDENVVTGKGAWILRNSWGSSSSYAYVYLAYDSLSSNIGFISGLTDQRDWDYSYNYYVGNLTTSYSDKKYVATLKNSIDINSQLDLIKVRTLTQNAQVEVYLSVNGDESNLSLLGTINTDMPGIATLDVSDKNIKINNNSKIIFSVINGSIGSSSIGIFTEEDKEDTFIVTKNTSYFKDDENIVDNHYKVRVYSTTYNIASLEEISYKLFDENNNDVTDQMIVSQNKVAYNNVNTLLYIPIIEGNDEFVLKTIYNGEVKSTSRLMPTILHPALGSGTEDDPYVITTPDELYSINYGMDSSYVLGNDIDLTYDTQNPDGHFYNDGLGWSPIGITDYVYFKGTLDGYYNGKTHKIIGLYSDSLGSVNRTGGLFYGISNYEAEKDVKVQNIIFEDSIVNNNNILSRYIYSYDSNILEIKNIGFLNSKVTGSFANLSNIISANNATLNISNIYSANKIDVSTSTVSSLASSISTTGETALINIDNIQILDVYKLESDNTYLSIISKTIAGNVNISNVIYPNSYGDMQYNQKLANLFTYAYTSSSQTIVGSLNNIYVGDNVKTNNSRFTEENIAIKTLKQFKTASEYSSWKNFSDNWEIKTVDGSTRLPVLKFVDFEYTSVDDITLRLGEVVDLYDYIYPKTPAARNISVSDSNDGVVRIYDDMTLMGLKPGITKVYIESRYDGYEGYITVTVESSNYSMNVIDDSTYITGLTSGVTVNDMIEEFDLSDEFIIKVFDKQDKQLSGDEAIFTGSVTRIYWNDTVYGDFYNIILGDVSGAGRVDISSAKGIVKHILGDNTLNDEYLLAADINNDGNVKMDDVMKLLKLLNS